MTTESNVVKAYLRTTISGSPGERFHAQNKLVELGTEAVPAIIEEAKKSSSLELLQTVSWVLGQVGEASEEALDFLNLQTRHSSNFVSQKAEFALTKLLNKKKTNDNCTNPEV